ncbi:MAG: hypothetical protein SVU32_01235 [Candidatus Nanohaloarchaea archaeon]|nr:hypothetical protein [Candidatus Nanohaloarchaea archaeon]
MISGILYVPVALGFAASAGLAYLFYRDFFAAERHPLEWKLMYAGLAVMAVAMALTGFYDVISARMLLQAGVVLRLLGSALLAVSGYILWDKFRL